MTCGRRFFNAVDRLSALSQMRKKLRRRILARPNLDRLAPLRVFVRRVVICQDRLNTSPRRIDVTRGETIARLVFMEVQAERP